MRRVLERLGLHQIDSVNVVVRAHYLPLFSRLGDYPRELLDTAAWGRTPRLFEYWAHEASLLPLNLQPLLRWRMARAERGQGMWGRLAPFAGERRGEADVLLARIAADGPVAASDVAELGPRAAGGSGAMPSMRSSGCSGPVGSPRPCGAAVSSVCTT